MDNTHYFMDAESSLNACIFKVYVLQKGRKDLPSLIQAFSVCIQIQNVPLIGHSSPGD